MANIEFLEPKTPVDNVYPKNDLDPPRTSLDLVIRQNGATLDDRFIRIQSLNAQDSISQLFQYQVEFRANDELSQSANTLAIDFNNIVGCSATVRVGLPEGRDKAAYPDPAFTVFFNGIVSKISMRESGVYSCILRPALWRLSLVNNYRQFSQMTIKEVIEEIVKNKWGLSCDTEGLGSLATYRSQDWMQMGESDWDYVQSLLHKVGGYFYFVHDDLDHKVVFANNPKRTVNYVNLPVAGTTDTSTPLPIYYTFTEVESLAEDDYLKSFSYEQKMVAPGTCNILAEPQAAWEKNSPADLLVCTDGDGDDKLLNHYRMFQFGTTKDLTISLNEEDAWTVQSQAFRLSGECTSPKFKPGHVFEARQAKSECNRPDVCLMRPELDKQRFVILSVSHKVGVDGSYSNQFTAALAAGNVTELNTNNTHVGSMLGQVVSKNDQRAKYRNHWMLEKGTPNFDPEVKTFYSGDGTPYTALGVYVDFLDLNVSDSPVWVKLSETMTTVPEAGVTVMVDRSRDDTDVPQISYIYEQKGSKNIMPNGTMENTRVGDDYSTSYGDSRSISYGAKSSVNLDAAISKIDGEYASGDFKSASYSLGGNYSYSASDKGEAGILSKSYSKGITYNESHGDSHSKSYADTTTNTSVVGNQTDESTITTSNRTTHIGHSSDNSFTNTSVRFAMTGGSSDTNLVGGSNSNSATILSNTNSALGVGLNINATLFETNVSFVGMRISTGIQNELTLKVRGGLRLVDTAAEMEARLDGMEAHIKELQLKM